MTWEKVKLGELATFDNGVNFSKSAYQQGCKLIGVADFKDYVSPHYDTLGEIDAEVVPAKSLLAEDDIIFVRSNGNKELVGRCMIIKDLPSPTTFAGFCIRCKFNDTKRDYPPFFNYLFKTKAFRQTLSGTSVGANIQNLSQSRLSNAEICHPSYAIQCKIAGILSKYDELIENSRKQIALLEEAAQRLYREWFVDFRFPGSTSHNSLPQGWTEGVVSDIIEQSGTNTYKKLRDEYDCYVPIDVIPKKSLVYINPNSIEDAESSLVSFKKGDVLFGAMRVYFHKVCIARHNGLTRSPCVVLNVKESEYYGYATMLLFSEQFVDQANQLSSGTTMPYIKWPKFAQIPITIPSKEIALKFDKLIQQLLNLAIEIENLISARDKLLPKLMSGELKV
jgi:type I restriction enzyme S subunit